MYLRRSCLAWLSSVAVVGALLLGAGSPVFAQGGTSLRIVVPYPAGGGSDRAARVLAEALQPRLGSPVIVENITGAGGRLAMRQLAAQPDTNVLVLANPALITVAPLVYKSNGYEPERDFQAVSQITTYEFAIAVAGAVPVREFNHLVAWLRANPEKANLGVPATGSLPHFFALMLTQQAKVDSQVVGYRGSAPLVNDLMGGHLPVAVDTLESLLPLHEGSKLRLLATSGEKRSVASVPTFKEAGLPVAATGWAVLFAKTGMPAGTVDRLSREIAAVMATAEVRNKLMAANMEPVSSDRETTRRMLQAFNAQWEPVIKKAGLQFD
jgi:tripartite-type tricarboxylate transporter receptor subunit TctC